MLDRFDLMIEVPEVPIHQMLEKTEQESSATIRDRVLAAQDFAARRHQGGMNRLIADLSPDEIDQAVGLDDDALALLHQAGKKNKRFRREACTGCCAWREPLPIWMVMTKRDPRIWLKLCVIVVCLVRVKTGTLKFRFNRVPNINRQIDPGKPLNFPQSSG